ncbi:ogr/Delta-like zinc finger family protein, partial [Edwardsiella tarda]
RYHQCTNVHCSATFRTLESIDEIIHQPAKPVTAERPTPQAEPRRVSGCYRSPFSH